MAIDAKIKEEMREKKMPNIDDIFRHKKMDYVRGGSMNIEDATHSWLKKALNEMKSFPQTKKDLRIMIQSPQYLLTTIIDRAKFKRITLSAIYVEQSGENQETGFALDLPFERISRGHELYKIIMSWKGDKLYLSKEDFDNAIPISSPESYSMVMKKESDETYSGIAKDTVDKFISTLEKVSHSAGLSILFRKHYANVLRSREGYFWGT